MKILKYVAEIFETNIYAIVSESNNAALIDPGGKGEEIVNDLKSKGVFIKKILLTHGHYDHTKSVAEIVNATGAEVYIHKDDGVKLTNSSLSLPHGMGAFKFTPVSNYKTYGEGDVISLDELKFLVYHTPGHTAGSVILRLGETLFTGDTIFKETIGATADVSANYGKLLDSVSRLVSMSKGDNPEIPLAAVILPGHGEDSTLLYETKHNPYLK